MSAIFESIRNAIQQIGYGTTLLSDIWSCFPAAMQDFVFVLFVVLFGSAAIALILKVLR